MKLDELHITRNQHGFEYDGIKSGEVGGRIKFSGAGGSNVEVVLKDYHITAILAVVADSMVVHTRELATELTTEIIEHAGKPLLTVEATK